MTMRNRHLLVSDLVAFVASALLAYTARYEGLGWLAAEQRTLVAFLALAIPARVAINWGLGLYQRVWSLASLAEVERIIAATVISGVATVLLGRFAIAGMGLSADAPPIGMLLLDSFLAAAGVTVSRIAVRIYYRRSARWASKGREYQQLPAALIIGAGSAGQIAARELLARPGVGFRPVAFLDDDPRKTGLRLGDLPVLGSSADIAKVALRTAARYAVIAVPSASGDAIRGLMQRARGAGLETRIVPSLHEHIARETGATPVRAIRIEDLLQREPIVTDVAAVQSQIEGKVVLITGAGGSIGSELCRQLGTMHPTKLVLVGRGENSIFEIQQELVSAFPFVTLTPVILDVRDAARMREVMLEHRPSAVFHAAAHKHVPLMEANVLEALRNNVLGTKSVVDAALAADVPRLVLISTDKAVRPTSVMGASKRIAEQVVQMAARGSGKAYVSVRFGNVLGSRGSVVPTFIKQIQAGGPVRVTHPEMRRYFMTIPEAVQLVLQAFVMGSCEELFCLDMGEPVKIVDLARDLISLSTSPNSAPIEVRIAGVRAGEKLYEELFFGAENAKPTAHPKVLSALGVDVSEELRIQLEKLLNSLSGKVDITQIDNMVRHLVDDFRAETASDFTGENRLSC